METFIKFKHNGLRQLRSSLLKDLKKEYYAVLYGKSNFLDNGNICIITVMDVKIYSHRYDDQTMTSIHIDSKFRSFCLNEIDKRVDVDTIIDVHTHPFSKGKPYFSSVDTHDEEDMKRYLVDKGDDIHYASIVFSQDMYNARLWRYSKETKRVFSSPAYIKTQTSLENIPNTHNDEDYGFNSKQREIFDRSFRALGVSAMKSIMSDQTITICGVGGIGSIIAEHLCHSGFQRINLIDFDVVETTNLNRLVGATYQDAKNNALKIDVIKKHLQNINPHIEVNCFPQSVMDPEIEKVLALSDWIFMTTDNYTSCVHIQKLAFKYFVPFISAATNIDTVDGTINDIRGEMILIRPGENVCLNCLGKIDKVQLTYEAHPDSNIREQFVQKGYVKGADIKDPAVKTLNSQMATLAVECLINQYTGRQKDSIVTIYENNTFPCIYPDDDCVRKRRLQCNVCGC